MVFAHLMKVKANGSTNLYFWASLNTLVMATIEKYHVREIRWPEKVFVTKRDKVSFDDLPTFFKETYGAIYNTIQKLKLTPGGMPCAFYYEIDEVGKVTDVAAAVPVQGVVPALNELMKVVLPPSRVITTTHYGSYESLAPAYAELDNFLKDNSLKKELIIEEYFSDPEVEKDPAKWKTNIYFIVRDIDYSPNPTLGRGWQIVS